MTQSGNGGQSKGVSKTAIPRLPHREAKDGKGGTDSTFSLGSHKLDERDEQTLNDKFGRDQGPFFRQMNSWFDKPKKEGGQEAPKEQKEKKSWKPWGSKKGGSK
ncbi:unnamed protein product [Periconia digitata]|uniref:Uncharacterized protein n=1 Tax=Periconia digitata TaxID=1303443 RepID=A0A9W4XPQ1_9PLEO|nr:unnamed protein product [Periconia digitata]